MVTRTTSTTVKFQRPFILDGFERIQEAGSYIVDTEEEQIDAVSFPAWHRVATVIQLTRAGATEYLAIDPEQLREALMRDGAQDDLALSAAKAQHSGARGKSGGPPVSRVSSGELGKS